MAEELIHSGLPPPWNYGVIGDGRVFFINEESKSTTWLHPVHNHPIQTGNISLRDLPRGWEQAYTGEGVPYYIDHTNLRTSFIHPVTGESALPVHEDSLTPPEQNSFASNQKQNFKRQSLRRRSNKQKVIDKTPTAKRSDDAPVAIKGWLYKQEGSGIKTWKKRWFVLSDFCLYIYKDSQEGQTVGSLLLPSYKIDYCHRDDGVNKKYSFKAEHQNMRTCYFATDTQDDQARWMKALTLATVLQKEPNSDYNRSQSASSPHGYDTSHPDDHQSRERSQDRESWRELETIPKSVENEYNDDAGGFRDSYRENPYSENPAADSQQRFSDTSGQYPEPSGQYPGSNQEPSGQFPSFESSQDRYPSPRDSQNLSPNLESTRNSGHFGGSTGQDINQSEDTGGFSDPRLSPRDQFRGQDISPRSDEPRESDNMNRHSFNHDPRAQRSNYDQRNSFNDSRSSINRAAPPSGHIDNRWSGYSGRDRDSLSSQDSRSNYNNSQRDVNYNMAKGQNSRGDQSYTGSGPPNTQRPQGQNHTISRDVPPNQNHPTNGPSQNYPQNRNYGPNQRDGPNQSFSSREAPSTQNFPGNRASNGYNSSTIDRSSDSFERTLDRSFDTSQQLPGYDSFRKERPDLASIQRNTGQDSRPQSYQDNRSYQEPSQRHQENRPDSYSRPQENQRHSYQDNQRPSSAYQDPQIYQSQSSSRPLSADSTHSSQPQLQKSESLRRLQEWTKSQMNNRGSRPSSGYDRDRPLSDGRRIYTSSSNAPSERSMSTESHRSPPPEPIKIPEESARPPIPAEYREQYIRELAETKTPHTRNDLLDSIQIQRMRKNEPLVFQYPEVRPPTKPDGNHGDRENPEREQKIVAEEDQIPKHQNQKVPVPTPRNRGNQQHNQEDINGPLQTLIDRSSSASNFHPTKSWDDLNELDIDADNPQGFDNRIEQLLAEKRQIEGSQQNKYFPDDFDRSRHDKHRSDTFRYVPGSPEKPVRRSLEPDYHQQESIYQNSSVLAQNNLHHNQKPLQNGVNFSSERSMNKSWQSLNHADVSRGPFDPNISQVDLREQPVSQSERDVRYSDVNDYYTPTTQSVQPEERLTQSLGNLHIDVGEWQENGVSLPRQPEPWQHNDRGPDMQRWDSQPQQQYQQPQQQQYQQSYQQPPPQQHVPQQPQWGQNERRNDSYGTPGNRHIDEGFGSKQRPTPQPRVSKRPIDTIKEDPAMSDQETLATKTLEDLQRHLSGHRMRLSIAAGDLGEKSHEELVLLLIQLRRDQAKLEHTRDHYRGRLDVARPHEKDYKLQRKNSIGRLQEAVEREHDGYVEIKKMYDELDNQLEVTKPLVSLLDNMVRMGSLYGGNNLMLASQYKQHKLGPGEYQAPKKMILFSRQYQEDKLTKEQEEELQQLMADEVDLEEKLQQLYRLDRDLQERSLAVMTLTERKARLERAVTDRRTDVSRSSDPRDQERARYALRQAEAELSTLRRQLTDSSRILEEVSAEDAKVENEVMLLRKKIYGVNRSQTSPTLGPAQTQRARQHLAEELSGIQDIMEGMSAQQSTLSDTIKALRHSTPDLTADAKDKPSGSGAYFETDMDSGRSRDISRESDPAYRGNPYNNRTASVSRREQVTMTTRDRSKSAPPPLNRNHDDPSIERQEFIMRHDGSKRDSIRSIGSYHEREAQRNSLSSDSQRNSGYYGSRTESKDGVYRAEMRMVTPEPREQYRIGHNNEDNASSISSRSSSGIVKRHEALNRYGDSSSLKRDQVGESVSVPALVEDEMVEGRVSRYIESLNTAAAKHQRTEDVDLMKLEQAREGGNKPAYSTSNTSTSTTNNSLDNTMIQVKSVYETGGQGILKNRHPEYRSSASSSSSDDEGSNRPLSEEYEKSFKELTGNDDVLASHNSTRDVLETFEHRLAEERARSGSESSSVDSSEYSQARGVEKGHSYSKKTTKHTTTTTTKKYTRESSSRLDHQDNGKTSSYETQQTTYRDYRDAPKADVSVQRADSRSKRLTSSLAMSMLEGKDQVIRDSLKRVASDASDYSILGRLQKRNQETEENLEGEFQRINITRTGVMSYPEIIQETNTVTSVASSVSNTTGGIFSTLHAGTHVSNPGITHDATDSESSHSTSSDDTVLLQDSRRDFESSSQHSSMVNVSKPTSEVRPTVQREEQQFFQQQMKYHGSGNSQNSQGLHQDQTFSEEQIYQPIELSEADDNTKKFFGLLPRDMSTRTVRDVKKEAERRSRERKRFYVNVHGPADIEQAEAMEQTQDFQRSKSLPRRTSAPVYAQQPQPRSHDDSVLKRKSVGIIPAKKAQQLESRPSASERLFTKPTSNSHYGNKTTTTTTTTNTSRYGNIPVNSVRKTAEIFSQRPMKDSEEKRYVSSSQSRTSSSVATVRPVVNKPEYKSVASRSLEKLDQKALDEEEQSVRQYWADRLKERHTPRGRYMTISGAQPSTAKPEQGSGWKPTKSHSAAGEIISGRWHDKVPDVVQYQPLKEVEFDVDTIDREVLYVPDKVEIPERYVPESEAETETEEDQQRRRQKTEQIKRMLAAQSLGDELGQNSRYSNPPSQRHLEAELQRREQLLDLRKQLAVQVTQKSKEVAGSYHTDTSSSVEQSYLPKSELSLYLMGRDGRGYVPSLPPHEASSSSRQRYDSEAVFSDSFC